jgi:hypothetical protein
MIKLWQIMDERYKETVNDSLPSFLTPEQKMAYARLSTLQINWKGKPIKDREEANENSRPSHRPPAHPVRRH